MKTPILLLAAAAAALIIQATQLLAGEPAGQPPPVTLTGSQSQIKKPGQFRLTSDQALAEVWLRHLGREAQSPYDFFYNPAQVPEVDFTRHMVIAIFAGEGLNCAGLSGLAVLDTPDALVLRMNYKAFQSQHPGTPSCAYAFFIVPRSPKPVLVQTDKWGGRQATPEWQEHARLPGEAAAASGAQPAKTGPAFSICFSDEPESPILTEKDLVSYDFEQHALRILAGTMARIPRMSASGRAFDVRVNGERIYTGRFVPAISSMAFNEPAITLGLETVTLKIGAGYPGEILPRTKPDPRGDERIRKVLSELHKLEKGK